MSQSLFVDAAVAAGHGVRSVVGDLHLDGTAVGVADVDDVQKRVISLCRDGIQPDVMMFLSCDRTVIEENHNFWYRIMQLR